MKSAGKNETLTNRKAVMLMMTAMVAVMMILLAVFWLSESQEIRIRAEKSIRQTMVNFPRHMNFIQKSWQRGS